MTQLRAFVGHSFTDDDAAVIGKFLKYLNQLAELHPTFSWQHAEPAEPTVLAEKVMSLLAGKNLFIGICTKKERVISPSALRPSVFLGKRLKAREEDFYWKTSDWIIQEIGLAIGLGLHVMLLVEQGLRPPGGLQGNLEYISFDRSAPEKCFGKLVEMITALSPKGSAPSMPESEPRSVPTEDRVAMEPPADDKWTTPKPEWKRRDYEFALRYMLATDNAAGAKQISDGYLATEMGSQMPNQKSWDAYVEYVRLVFGKGGQLATLKRLSDENPRNSDVLSYLARAYGHYQQDGESARVFENAAQEAEDICVKLKLLREAASAHQRAWNSEAAWAVIARMKSMAINTGEFETEVLRAQRKVAEIAKNDEILIGVMERLLAVDPADNDTRFALAYKCSELGNEDLALFHYSKIPAVERSAVTWNNLGVAYDQLGLPAKSVTAYRKAEEMSETLAMSNLANKLVGVGFLPEAQKLCDIALAIKDYHKNAAITVGRLKEVPAEEENKEADLLEKARPISDFYKEVGRAVAKLEPATIAGRWQGPDCLLDVTLTGMTFTATGSYERRSLNMLGALLAGSGRVSSEDDSAPIRYRVEYRGKAVGCAIMASVIRRREDELAQVRALLASSDDEHEVVMVLTDDGNELRVLETGKSNSPRLYSLHR